MLEFIVLRLVALFLIILVSLINVSYLKFISTIEWQIILGTIIIAFILFGDAITGLLFGLLFLIIYLRYYMIKLNINFWETKYNKYPMKNLVTDYITEQNLKDAQNNIVNERNHKNAYIGIQGVYGEDVYSAQGIDKIMPGITKSQEVNQFVI
jgi:hypothetical protein